MIKLKEKEYSGYVVKNENDVLTVVIHTADNFDEIAKYITDVTSVTWSKSEQDETVYNITVPLSAKRVSQNVYALDFSTKPTETQQMEATLQAHSDAIDEMLVMLLEE